MKPISSVRIFDGSFIEGSSDDVIYFPDNLNSSQVLEITGNSGEGIFSIKTINCDGEFNELLVLLQMNTVVQLDLLQTIVIFK